MKANHNRRFLTNQAPRDNSYYQRQLDNLAGFHVNLGTGNVFIALVKEIKYRDSRKQDCFISDETLGQKAGGYSRGHTNREKQKWKKVGWLFWQEEDYGRPPTPNYFLTIDEAKFKRFCFLFLLAYANSFLLSFVNSVQQLDITLFNKGYIYNPCTGSRGTLSNPSLITDPSLSNDTNDTIQFKTNSLKREGNEHLQSDTRVYSGDNRTESHKMGTNQTRGIQREFDPSCPQCTEKCQAVFQKLWLSYVSSSQALQREQSDRELDKGRLLKAALQHVGGCTHGTQSDTPSCANTPIEENGQLSPGFGRSNSDGDSGRSISSGTQRGASLRLFS